MLSERSWTEKTTFCMLPFIRGWKTGKKTSVIEKKLEEGLPEQGWVHGPTGKGREGPFCNNGIVLNVLRGVQLAGVWAFVETQ